jgi:hypothetical protein
MFLIKGIRVNLEAADLSITELDVYSCKDYLIIIISFLAGYEI